MLKRPTTLLGWIAWIAGGTFALLCGCLALGLAIGGMNSQRQAEQPTVQSLPTREVITIQPEPDRATEEPTQRPRPTTRPAPTNAPQATAEANESILPGYVSRETMGDDWPLSIDEGLLVCTAQREILLTTNQGIYAVNGTARGRMDDNGWKDINDITVEGSAPGLIKNLGPLLDIGLGLCK